MGAPLVVHLLGLHTFTAKVPGSMPGWGTNNQCGIARKRREKKKEEQMNKLMWVGEAAERGQSINVLFSISCATYVILNVTTLKK